MTMRLIALFLLLVAAPASAQVAPPPGPLAVSAFDLGTAGTSFTVRGALLYKGRPYLIVYAPQFPAAALVDVQTGLAQIAYPFFAGLVPDSTEPALTFTDVTVLTPFTYVWWQGGRGTARTWDTTLPWQPMPTFRR